MLALVLTLLSGVITSAAVVLLAAAAAVMLAAAAAVLLTAAAAVEFAATAVAFALLSSSTPAALARLKLLLLLLLLPPSPFKSAAEVFVIEPSRPAYSAAMANQQGLPPTPSPSQQQRQQRAPEGTNLDLLPPAVMMQSAVKALRVAFAPVLSVSRRYSSSSSTVAPCHFLRRMAHAATYEGNKWLRSV
jgi:hypothetical protein